MKMSEFLIAIVVLLCLAVPKLAMSQPSLRLASEPAGCIRLLVEGKKKELEQLLPQGDLFWELEEIAQNLTSLTAKSFVESHPKASVEVVYNRFVEIRLKVADSLERTLTSLRISSRWESFIKYSIEQIRFQPKRSLTDDNSHLLIANNNNPRLLKKIMDELDALISNPRGIIYELMVSSVLPHVTHVGTKVRDILSHDEKKKIEPFMSEVHFKKVMSYEIDVVYNNGEYWGEVKGGRQNKGKIKSLVNRSLILQELAEAMQKAGLRPFKQSYFLMNEVDLSFSESLIDLGYEVYAIERADE